MNPCSQDNSENSIAALEARAFELQRELSLVQARLAELNSGKTPARGREVPLAPAWDTPIPISSPPDSATAAAEQQNPQIYLQPLQPYHALRAKWQLGSGLENALTPDIASTEPDTAGEVATHLRLFGLQNHGEPWEQVIPFARIAQNGGIILGRSADEATYAIEDASISRQHLRLHLNEYGLAVSDLGSTNGSAVNGIALTAYDNTRQLQDGDMLTIGSIQLQIEFL